MNKHEFTPEHGYVVSEEVMIKDIKLMKEHNLMRSAALIILMIHAGMNCVMNMDCYVMDEANIETHGMTPMNRLRQMIRLNLPLMSERVTRMVNAVTVIIHQLLFGLFGNESGYGK